MAALDRFSGNWVVADQDGTERPSGLDLWSHELAQGDALAPLWHVSEKLCDHGRITNRCDYC